MKLSVAGLVRLENDLTSLRLDILFMFENYYRIFKWQYEIIIEPVGFRFMDKQYVIGIPVITSKVTSLPAVVPGEHISVEPKNPEAIADAIKNINDGKVQYINRMVFTWNSCYEKYFKVFQILIGNKKATNSQTTVSYKEREERVKQA